MLELLACQTDGNTQLRQSLPGYQAEPALISLPDPDSPHNPNSSLIQPSLNLQLLPTLHPTLSITRHSHLWVSNAMKV